MNRYLNSNSLERGVTFLFFGGLSFGTFGGIASGLRYVHFESQKNESWQSKFSEFNMRMIGGTVLGGFCGVMTPILIPTFGMVTVANYINNRPFRSHYK